VKAGKIDFNPERNKFTESSIEESKIQGRDKKPRLFIKKLSDFDVFSLKPGDSFYGAISDPFEYENVSKASSSKPCIYCMFPTPKDFMDRKREHKFAPLISICLADAERSAQILRENIPRHIPGKPIVRITDREREAVIEGIALAFDEAFVGGISVPMDALCVKECGKLKTTYNTALGIMLIPLLRMHADASIPSVSIRLPSFGGSDYGGIKQAKELLKAMRYTKESDVQTFNSTQRDLWLCFRFIYWAAYKAHNLNDSFDLIALEEKLSNQGDGAGT
jgi:hypothetical protein